MTLFKKLYWLIYPLLLVLFIYILDKGFHVTNFFISAIIAGSLAYFLSPRKKRIQTKKGLTKQIYWVFLKEPIVISEEK